MSGRAPAGADRFAPTAVTVVLVVAMLSAAMIPWWPIYESADTFAIAREVDALEAGDLAAFRTAGAYGATMANTYNSRALVPEVMVDGGKWAVVADRIEPAASMAAERVPEWLG